MRPVVTLLALLLVPAPALGQEPDYYYDRFRLFTECSSVRVSVVVEDDESDLGLSEERVETAVRSRLRGARIFYSGPTLEAMLAVALEDRDSDWHLAWQRRLRSPSLSVYVHVVGPAHRVSVEMLQDVRTYYTDLSGIASTWSRASTGTHGGNPAFVLGSVSEKMDGFIDDYLRVNEEAC